MPNLVVYVPAAIWKRLEKAEGKASAKVVARAICKAAIEEHVSRPGFGGTLAQLPHVDARGEVEA